MLRLIIYLILIYFIGKWAWKWLQQNISIDNNNRDESVKGRPRSELDIEINKDDVEDVNFTEIDEEEDED
jgi:hypothetical protein